VARCPRHKPKPSWPRTPSAPLRCGLWLTNAPPAPQSSRPRPRVDGLPNLGEGDRGHPYQPGQVRIKGPRFGTARSIPPAGNLSTAPPWISLHRSAGRKGACLHAARFKTASPAAIRFQSALRPQGKSIRKTIRCPRNSSKERSANNSRCHLGCAERQPVPFMPQPLLRWPSLLLQTTLDHCESGFLGSHQTTLPCHPCWFHSDCLKRPQE